MLFPQSLYPKQGILCYFPSHYTPNKDHSFSNPKQRKDQMIGTDLVTPSCQSGHRSHINEGRAEKISPFLFTDLADLPTLSSYFAYQF